jgi:hypothetical protein
MSHVVTLGDLLWWGGGAVVILAVLGVVVWFLSSIDFSH